MNLLVPNLGSTSFKYQLLEMPPGRQLACGRAERVSDYARAIAEIDTGGAPIDAVALKAVHGGPDYVGTFLVDDGVVEALRAFLPAAPAHNAVYLEAIEGFRRALPATPLVAAFETQFHASMPACASQYGVPAEWQDRGVRRYGFHGASHEYVSGRVPEMLGCPVRRLVSLHLGGSSSACAISDGRSVDTTMGFSPQSGLENATRPGELDAFAVLYMMERYGKTVAEVRQELSRGGGLAGLSGIAGGDVRDIEASEDPHARCAIEVFAWQVRKTIGAYAAAMGGLDAIAFTGGIGENAAVFRAEALAGLSFLGVEIDPGRNQQGGTDRVISSHGAPVAVVVLRTNEELVVARRAYRLLTAQP